MKVAMIICNNCLGEYARKNIIDGINVAGIPK